MMTAYVYILASGARRTLYVGVTNDLVRRTHEHRQGAAEGFTKKYDVKRLVYFESFDDIAPAITREKQIKRWHRPWKFALIEKDNPGWRDLFGELAK